MSSQLLGSKTIVVEEAPTGLNFPSLNTSVAGVAMVTKRGPIGVATRCTSREQFKNIFGSHHANSDSMAYVDAFFDNGGTELWVVRVVHYTDITSPASKTSAQATLTLVTAAIAAQSGHVDGTVTAATFAMSPADTLKVKVDGAGALTATFNATAAARASGNQPYALANSNTLTVSIDGGGTQTITFLTGNFVAIGAATAAEVAAVINAGLVGGKATVTAGPAVTITSDRKGTGSGVNVIGGSGNGVLGFTTGNLAGTGNVSNVLAVTLAEIKTVVEAAVAGVTVTSPASKVIITRNTTGAAASVQIDGTGTLQTVIGLDLAVHAGVNSGTLSTLQVQGKTDGTYANNVSLKIAAASSGASDAFNLQVLDSTGVTVEQFPNLSMTDGDVRYVETIVNADIDSGGSKYIVVTDLDATTPSPNDVPAIGTFGPLTGGSDGLASLADTDFIGSSAADPKTGMQALAAVENQTLLAVPGQSTAAIQNAMATYCEITRGGQVYAVMGTPAGLSATAVVTYFKSTAALKNLTEDAGFYWPRVKVSNPSAAIYGTVPRITLDPCMHVCGAISRVDNSRVGGVYEPPAGLGKTVLFGVLELERAVNSGDDQTDLVYPENINPIASPKGGGAIFIDGTKNLKSIGNWPQIQQRRGVSFIERSLSIAIDPVARHNNNTPALRAEVARGMKTFLGDQMQVGAFKSLNPDECFFVDVGDALNPSSQANTLTARTGLAMGTSTDFVVLRFGKFTATA